MKSAAQTRHIIDLLETQHPGADTELHYRTAFELLVATILSAQSTDARVNMVTPALFARYPDARALAAATPEEVEPMIHSTGFFRAKAKSIIGMAQILVAEHRGEVPASMDALTPLPGVGRKTANVVLGHALGIPGLPVDRHVLRVANRLGIAEGDDPVKVESQLCAAMPPERWTLTSDLLILHGRRVCKPTPLCEQCAAREHCDFVDVLERERTALPRRTARTGAGQPGRKPATARTAAKAPVEPSDTPARPAGHRPSRKGPRGASRVRTPRR